MFEISLYKNSAENNRVDKTEYLTLVKTVSGTLRDESSITDLEIEIAYNKVPDFNYIFIREFNRYYYVTDVANIVNNLWSISLSVDVLMSYKDGILNSTAFVDRNEFNYNRDIIDTRKAIMQGYDVETKVINNLLFSTVELGMYSLSGLGFYPIREES